MKLKCIKIFLKKNVKLLLAFIVGGIIFGAVGVYASTVINSKDVLYSNTNSGLTSTDVQSTIDEVAEKSKSHCPDGYACSYKCTGASCPKCVRATSLHTKGDETYGNLGTKGVLNSGDAFDCDVNGDNVYDANTERFYYVTDLQYSYNSTITTNDDIAVLIYSNNVYNGQITTSSSGRIPYNTSGSVSTIQTISLASHLPTNSQWITLEPLYSKSGQILTISDTTLKDNYIPIDRSMRYGNEVIARLLTTQEIKRACDITEYSYTNIFDINDCKYLINYNGGGDYWLETPDSTSSNEVYYLDIGGRISSSSILNTHGVRPVIEVKKSEIEF